MFVNIWHGSQTVKARKASVCSLNSIFQHSIASGPSLAHCVTPPMCHRRPLNQPDATFADTSSLRVTQGIGYPNTYATDEQAKASPAAFQLNCGKSCPPLCTHHSWRIRRLTVFPWIAQRAHANFTENLTPFMATLLIAGTRYPVQAAVMGAGWLVSRIVYTAGCK